MGGPSCATIGISSFDPAGLAEIGGILFTVAGFFLALLVHLRDDGFDTCGGFPLVSNCSAMRTLNDQYVQEYFSGGIVLTNLAKHPWRFLKRNTQE